MSDRGGGVRRRGFDRVGWAVGAGDGETRTLITQTYRRADAFLFGRRTYELFAGSWGAIEQIGQGTRLFPATGPDIALDLVESRADGKGVMIQVYRPAGRPQYAAD